MTAAPAVQFSFVFIDLTTDKTVAALKPAPYFSDLIAATIELINGKYAPAWGEACCNFRVGASPSDRKPNEIAINFRDSLPDAPGALAYHAVTNGVPDIEVGCDLFESLTSGSESVSVGVGHEVLETLQDAGANAWCDRQDNSGLMDAREIVDFVQNTTLTASNGVSIPNFLLPSFFIPGAPAPWDFSGVMKAFRDVSNGYGIVVGSPSSEKQIGGMADARGIHTLGTLTETQRARKNKPWSRSRRRGAKP